MVKSSLQITETLKFSPLNANKISTLSFTIDPDSDVNSFSFHVYYNAGQITSTGKINLTLIGPNSTNVPGAGAPFLYETSLQLYATGLSQGYCAVIVPVNDSQVSNVSGDWQATLDFSGFNDQNVNPQDMIQVVLCERSINASPTEKKSITLNVPTNFFFAGNIYRGWLPVLTDAINYLNKEIYAQAGIRFIYKEIQLIDNAGINTINSNLYDPATANLVSSNAKVNAVNVFFIPQTKITKEDAVGFSVTAGPQGFLSPYSCVFIKLHDPRSPGGHVQFIARRIAHEVGHYLGLIDQSSCLDYTGTKNDITSCNVALKPANRNTPAAQKIQNNVMYTSKPGDHLNHAQIFQLWQAPLILQIVPDNSGTPIYELIVTIKTGVGVYSWFALDSAGTDDDVFFTIGNSDKVIIQKLDTWKDDFESDSESTYQLDPQGLSLENIERFKITKLYNPSMHLFSEDAWLLEGVIIQINSQVVYNQQNIHQWIIRDDSDNNDYYEGTINI